MELFKKTFSGWVSGQSDDGGGTSTSTAEDTRAAAPDTTLGAVSSGSSMDTQKDSRPTAAQRDYANARPGLAGAPTATLQDQITLSYLPPVIDPATRREIWLGFYGYAAAISVFQSLALSVYMPALIQDLAASHARQQQRAVQAQQCTVEVLDRCLKCIPGQGIVYVFTGGDQIVQQDLTVSIGATEVTPEEYPEFVKSMGNITKIIAVILLGPLADHGLWRKRMMSVSTALGGLLCASAVFLWDPRLYWVAAVLYCGASAALGVAVVCYFPYLPILADNTLAVEAAAQADSPDYQGIRNGWLSMYSQLGMFWGNLVGSAVLGAFVAFATQFEDGNSTTAWARAIVCFAGLWWLTLGLISTHSLGARPGSPIPEGRNFLVWSLSSTWRTMRRAKEYPQAFVFLLCNALIISPLGALSSLHTADLQQLFCVAPIESVITNLTILAAAAVGCLAYLAIQRVSGARNAAMFLVNSAFFFMICLWGTIGMSSARLNNKESTRYLISGFVGLNLGSTVSVSRAIFANLTPPGSEARFFAFYIATSFLALWTGDAVYTSLLGSTGTERWSFLFLTITSLLGTLLLLAVFSEEKGMLHSGRRFG